MKAPIRYNIRNATQPSQNDKKSAKEVCLFTAGATQLWYTGRQVESTENKQRIAKLEAVNVDLQKSVESLSSFLPV